MTIYLDVPFDWQMFANNIGDGDTFAPLVFTYTIPTHLYWNSYHCAAATTIEYSINSGTSYSPTPPGDLHTLTNVRITYTDVVLAADPSLSIYMNMYPNTIDADVLSSFTVTTLGDQDPSNNTNNHHLAIIAFAPPAFNGLLLWLDAQQNVYTSIGPNVPAVNNDPVARWDDRSVGIHSDQATLTNKPIYNTGLANGLNGLTFDGVNDFMTIANTFIQPTGSPYTAFFVTNPTNPAATPGAEGLIATTAGEVIWWHKAFTGSNDHTGMVSGVTVTPFDAAQSGLQLYTFESGGGNNILYRDGTLVATVAGQLNEPFIGGKLGSGVVGTTQNFKGVIYEIVVYNSVLNSTDRGLVEQYLTNKYAI